MTRNPGAFVEAFNATVDLYVEAARANDEALMFQAGQRFAHLCTLTEEPRASLLEKVRDAAASVVASELPLN